MFEYLIIIDENERTKEMGYSTGDALLIHILGYYPIGTESIYIVITINANPLHDPGLAVSGADDRVSLRKVFVYENRSHTESLSFLYTKNTTINFRGKIKQ